jgi:hypothetical protein
VKRLIVATLILSVFTFQFPALAASRKDKTLASSSGFQFPNPEISIGRVPRSTEEKYDAARLWAAQYTQQFIAQFLLLNGLRENLFNVRDIMNVANKQIDSIPGTEIDNPEKVTQRMSDFRKGLIALADKLYAKDRPQETKFSGRSRLDAIENRLSDLRNVNAQLADIQQKIEAFGQRLTLVEQRKLPATLPAQTIVESGDPKTGRLAWAALLLAAGSFFFQIYGRRK